MQMITTRKNGFTLIELSIVLTVIGLIVGGVMSGQSLIHAARIRQIYTQSAEYIQAINTFKDKYDALPGDMADATSHWGAADPDPVVCLTTDNNDKTTCNGTGNGIVNNTVGDSYEMALVWKHLANDGMIKGKYTGIGGPMGEHHGIPGVNIPRWKGRAGFTLFYVDPSDGTGQFFIGDSLGHVIYFGREDRFGGQARRVIISAADAYAIDTKIDDGSPGNGNLRTFQFTAQTNCVTTDDPATSIYAVTTSTEANACMLIFLTGF